MLVLYIFKPGRSNPYFQSEERSLSEVLDFRDDKACLVSLYVETFNTNAHSVRGEATGRAVQYRPSMVLCQ